MFSVKFPDASVWKSIVSVLRSNDVKSVRMTYAEGAFTLAAFNSSETAYIEVAVPHHMLSHTTDLAFAFEVPLDHLHKISNFCRKDCGLMMWANADVTKSAPLAPAVLHMEFEIEDGASAFEVPVHAAVLVTPEYGSVCQDPAAGIFVMRAREFRILMNDAKGYAPYCKLEIRTPPERAVKLHMFGGDDIATASVYCATQDVRVVSPPTDIACTFNLEQLFGASFSAMNASYVTCHLYPPHAMRIVVTLDDFQFMKGGPDKAGIPAKVREDLYPTITFVLAAIQPKE